MSFPTRNNPDPIEFKKEIEILEKTTSFGHYNNYKIPFKKEPIDANNNTVDYSNCNHYRIIQLEIENKSLKFKINDLNEIIQEQSYEISDLKLRLNKYEPILNHVMSTSEIGTNLSRNENETIDNNQSEETTLGLTTETNHLMSSCESDNDSDQSENGTTNKVINII